jgi:hypothetical protein
MKAVMMTWKYKKKIGAIIRDEKRMKGLQMHVISGEKQAGIACTETFIPSIKEMFAFSLYCTKAYGCRCKKRNIESNICRYRSYGIFRSITLREIVL